jgi:hypothetical protein
MYLISGLMALFLFFLSERMINMMGDWREARKRKIQEEIERQAANNVVDGGAALGSGPKVRVVRSGHRASERSFGRERLCKHKYSNYCVDDVIANKDASDPEAVAEISTMIAGTDTTDTLMHQGVTEGTTSGTFSKKYKLRSCCLQVKKDRRTKKRL